LKAKQKQPPTARVGWLLLDDGDQKKKKKQQLTCVAVRAYKQKET